MRCLQAVTVGAEDSEILEPIVEAIAVDVIELDGNATIRCALGPTAKLTARLL